MKKIGILTFQRAINYGAALQMYALQKKIRDLGANAEIIDFICPYIFDGYKPFHLRNIIHPHALMGDILNFSTRKSRNKHFHDFIRNNMHFSQPVDTESLSILSDAYDIYITGSDQVWNPLITGSESAYFLDFVKDKNKRRSYAASFGVSEWPPSSLPVTKLLESMDSISVREEMGKKLIQSLTSRTASVTVDVDPVFLLEKNSWLSMIRKDRTKKPYLFIYLVGGGNPDDMYRTASRFAQEQHLDIINLRYNRSLRHKEYEIGNVVYDAGPDDFVSFIANASCVVTNSFHATAFSIIFHKDMYVSMPDKIGSRISNLFSITGIEGRVIGKPFKAIDWEKADQKIMEARQVSVSHLKKIIGE